jgi:predicted HTH domain antitoxin
MEIPEARLSVLEVDRDHAGAELQFLAAAKLFELGRLSSGAAAEFAAMPKPMFLERLAKLGVPAVTVDEKYLAGETRLA